MCPSNLETRQQRDLCLCNKPRSALKRLLAAAPEVRAPSCLWCRAMSGSRFHPSRAHGSATQQKHCQRKIHLLTLTLFIHPCFPFPVPHAKKLHLHIMSLSVIMI